MIELKPCPFCGGKAYLFANDGVRVICTKIELWNRRATDGKETEVN